MDGTPLGRRGIAAVAGGHCVGLPLKCNHSRAKASGSSRGSDRAKQSRYTDKHKQPPQGHALAKMSKVAGGGDGDSQDRAAKFASKAALRLRQEVCNGRRNSNSKSKCRCRGEWEVRSRWCGVEGLRKGNC